MVVYGIKKILIRGEDLFFVGFINKMCYEKNVLVF